MLNDELETIHDKLGELLDKVDPDTATTLKLCRRNLKAAMDDVKNMESNLYPKENV